MLSVVNTHAVKTKERNKEPTRGDEAAPGIVGFVY